MNRRDFFKASTLVGFSNTFLHIAKGAGYWTFIHSENELKMSALFSMQTFAQEFPNLKASKNFLKDYSQKTFSQMQADRSHDWIKTTFKFTKDVFDEITPSFTQSPAREGAFHILDYPLRIENKHRFVSKETKEMWYSAMHEIFGANSRKLINSIENSKPENSVDIFKFYNVSTVVKSKDVCIAIDLRSQFEIPFSNDEINALVKNIDALFITHHHGDHIDIALIEAFLKAGKKVYAPHITTVFKDIAKKYPKNFVVIFPENKCEIIEVGNAKMHVYGSRHLIWSNKEKACPNNVYLLEIGGKKIVHTGDNGTVTTYERIAEEHKVDVLMPAIWAKMITAIYVIRPEKVIPIHEQELNHPVHSRVQYRWFFNQIDDMKTGNAEYDPNEISWTYEQVKKFKSTSNGYFPKYAVLAHSEKIKI